MPISQGNREVRAPIVRKPGLKRKRHKQPNIRSVVPGIRHFVEGAPTPQYRTARSPVLLGLNPKDDAGSFERGQRSFLDAIIHNRREEEKVELFDRKQELRKGIVSLPDPDDLSEKARRRRQARRRSLRGRAGTLLSQRDGQGGTLG